MVQDQQESQRRLGLQSRPMLYLQCDFQDHNQGRCSFSTQCFRMHLQMHTEHSRNHFQARNGVYFDILCHFTSHDELALI